MDYKKQKHYSLKPEPIDITYWLGGDFNLGNVIKYTARYPYKGQAIADLNKAIAYCDFAMDRMCVPIDVPSKGDKMYQAIQDSEHTQLLKDIIKALADGLSLSAIKSSIIIELSDIVSDEK